MFHLNINIYFNFTLLIVYNFFMINKRCKNTLPKKYRRYRSDIRNNLILKQSYYFIRTLIYDFSQMNLRRRLRKVSRKALTKISFKNFNYDIITVKTQVSKSQFAFLGLFSDLETISVVAAMAIPIIAFGTWCFSTRTANKQIIEEFHVRVENDIQRQIDPLINSADPYKLTNVTREVSLKKISVTKAIEAGKLQIKPIGDTLTYSKLEALWLQVQELQYLGDPLWLFLNSLYADLFYEHIPLSHSGYLYLVEWFAVLTPLEIHEHSRISWIIINFLLEFSKFHGLHA